MKRFLAILLLLPFALSAQKRFVIEGTLQGLPEGTEVTLSNANNPNDTIARSTVKNGGSFELKGMVDEPNLFQLNLDGIQKKSVLFIGDDKVTVTGDVASFPNFMVKGSRVHDDFVQFRKVFEPMFQQLTAMSQRINRTPSLRNNDS